MHRAATDAETAIVELAKAALAKTAPVVHAAEFNEFRREMSEQLSIIIKQLTSNTTEGWLDARAAAKYMGLSSGSFDKYRYKTTPRITGYNLDGKTLYKRAELDQFIKLYEIKSSGLA